MLGVFAASLATPAYAYIDPVTGSFVVQGIVAGILALSAGVRSIRERIVALFRRRRSDSQV